MPTILYDLDFKNVNYLNFDSFYKTQFYFQANYNFSLKSADNSLIINFNNIKFHMNGINRN